MKFDEYLAKVDMTVMETEQNYCLFLVFLSASGSLLWYPGLSFMTLDARWYDVICSSNW
jgi:hypothetical protein